MESWKIFLLMFMTVVLAAIVTLTLIINRDYNYYSKKIDISNSSTNDNETEKIKPVLYEEYHIPVDDETLPSKYGYYYYTNALKWEKVLYEDDKLYGYYYQISGMKNKQVQEKVNNKIKQSAIDFGNNEYDLVSNYNNSKNNSENDNELYRYRMSYIYVDNKVVDANNNNFGTKEWKAYFDQCVAASFSNVISVATGPISPDYIDCYSYSRKYDSYLNLDLNTGDELNIEDLFCKDADILTVIRNALYLKLPIGSSFKYDTHEVEYSEGEVYEEIYNMRYEEVDVDKLERLVKKFKYTKDIDFYFTYSDFGLRLDDYFVIINYQEFEGKIAIYNRFVTTYSLFSDDSLSHKLLCFKEYNCDETVLYSVTNEISNGIVYNYTVYYPAYDGSEEKNRILENGIKNIKESVEKEKEVLKKLKSLDEYIYYYRDFYIEDLYSDLNKRDYFNLGAIYKTKFQDLIDETKTAYKIVSYNEVLFKYSSEEIENGELYNYYKHRYLNNTDWTNYHKIYEEYYNAHDFGKVYADYYGYTYLYKLDETLYDNVIYDSKNGKKFEKPRDIILYILKNSSEEGLNEYFDLVCEAFKNHIKNLTTTEYYENITKENLKIENNRITYNYYSKDYNYMSSVSFDFVYTDYYYSDKAYPVRDFNGMT